MTTAALERLSKHIPGCVEVVCASCPCGRHQRLGIFIVVLSCLMKVFVDCGGIRGCCSAEGFSLQGKQMIPLSYSHSPVTVTAYIP